MNEQVIAALGTGTGAVITQYLVSLFKMGYPAATPARIVGVALLSGQIGTALVGLAAGGLHLTISSVASYIVFGILATAGAAGLNRTDQSAEAKRIGPDVQANREMVAEVGAKAEKEAASDKPPTQ